MNISDFQLPPQSIEAEQSVIGGLLLDNNGLDKIADILDPVDFYRNDHRLIFEHMRYMIERGLPADIVTLAEALELSGKLQEVGGIAYLGALAQNVPGTANIRRYAEIVHEKSVFRGLLGIAAGIRDACQGQGSSTAEIIAQNAEEKMMRLLDRRGGDPEPFHATIASVLMEIEKRRELGGKLAGVPTGMDQFDELTGGLEAGQLIIIAARPSVGKTVLGCNIADYVAQRATTLFFTLEMTKREIGMRILATRSEVPMHFMRGGTDTNEHWDRMGEVHANSGKTKLFIDDMAAATVGYIRAKARRIKRQHGLGLIVIDYLQLMRGQQGVNRTQEVGSISRGLKALAKEMQVPIIALAQLNRGVEGRVDRRPVLSDLRDSGEVEQDADIVAMVHREELYNEDARWKGYAELLVRKNRNGPTGDITLKFDGELMKFKSQVGSNIRQILQQKPSTQRRGFD